MRQPILAKTSSCPKMGQFFTGQVPTQTQVQPKPKFSERLVKAMLDFAQSRPIHLRQNQLINAIGTRRNGYWKVAMTRTRRLAGAPLPSSRGAEKTAEIGAQSFCDASEAASFRAAYSSWLWARTNAKSCSVRERQYCADPKKYRGPARTPSSWALPSKRLASTKSR